MSCLYKEHSGTIELSNLPLPPAWMWEVQMLQEQILPDRPVAQLVEQRSPKPQVGGSSPSWPANINKMAGG